MSINDIAWISAASALNGNLLQDPAKDIPRGLPLSLSCPQGRQPLIPTPPPFPAFFISCGILPLSPLMPAHDECSVNS